MILARRGLNFVTEHHEANLDQECIEVVEKEVDNVAPKIIGVLGLSESCEIGKIR